MKFGACAGSIERYIASFNAGCDFVEFNAADLSKKSDEEIQQIKSLVKEYGVPVEVTNCLFPDEIMLSASKRDMNAINEYTSSLFYKLADVGVKVSVFGSGRARKVPEGENKEECMERFYSSVYTVAENARKNGIEIALEPLRSAECNLFNTVEEAARICYMNINK